MKKIVIFVTLILALLMCMASCDSLPSFGSKSEDAPALDSKPEHTHEFGEWFTTEEPTCTSNGVKARYCSCGEKQNETIPKLTHNVVIDASVAPTCTETGLTEGKHCSVCNEILVMQLEIQKGAHSYDNANDAECNVCGFVRNVECTHELVEVRLAKPATCTQSGLTQGRVCVDCEEVLVEQTVIDPLGHTEVVDDAVAPTCSTTGLTEGKHCSVCNDVLVAQTVIGELGHIEVIDKAVAPTCTETGLTEGKHCSVCNTVLIAQESVDKTSHTEGDWIIDIEATTSSEGARHTECTGCGIIIRTETIGKIPSKGLEFTLNDDGISYSVKSMGTCTDTDIIIPSTYNDKSVTSIGDYAFCNCSSLTSVVIPDSVTSIGKYAFYYCNSLTSVVIGDSVTSIGYKAFSYCTSLTNIEVDDNNPHYKDIDGNLYTKDGTLLIQYAIGKTATSFIIPDTVTSIGDSAFEDCDNITSVIIPSSIRTIGSDSFYQCSELTDVILSEGLESIGFAAFKQCYALTNIKLPSTITSIGDHSFYGPSLKHIVIPDGVSYIGYQTFICGAEIIELGNAITYLGSGAFASSNLSVVIFRGTISEWIAIVKDPQWDVFSVSYTVYCTDGEITKDGTVTYY